LVRPLARGLYEAAGQLARALAEFAPDGTSKVGRSLSARRGIRARYAAWGAASRDPARPLIWIHAPSVGEGLQAKPVIELLRAEHPQIQLAYTHFSPSATAFAASLGVDFHDYLPFDTTPDTVAALDALRPDALVFSKLDVWPTLALEAASRGIGLGLISATVSPESSRQQGVVRWLMEPAYAALSSVGAISDDDAQRLTQLGVRHEALSITGDTRYDQVWRRAESVDRSSPLLAALASDRPTIVAGSTWPSDESPLLASWQIVRTSAPHARLIIAPHEPTESHIRPLEQAARAAGLQAARLGAATATTDVVVVDRVGVLGELYLLATGAFVGGGFHGAGLHSVLEPAAFGAPVLFGPQFANSRDAVKLLERGGGATARTAEAMAAHLARWVTDSDARRLEGDRAREMVRAGLGAARRSTDLVMQLLQRRRG
jgi:3-deoxy-D-manno-octulosonic-acid transferase